MSRLRGDDDLLSLMGEMASQQGYEEPAPVASETLTSRRNADSSPPPRIRLTAEVSGYPSEKQLAGGGEMIWNPYIHVSSSPTKCAFPPTNPQVEVFRRRAYERFKNEFRESLERLSAGTVAGTAPAKANSLWSELSPVSMMERWHFDAKLQEFLVTENTTSSSSLTTPQIKMAMEGGFVDPILTSTDTKGKQQKRKRGGQTNDKASTPFRSPSSLLAAEVKFEWTRTWKRIAGEKYKESDLTQVFESKKFHRKMTRFSRSVMEAAAEVEASFHEQVNKRASLEAQQSGRQSKKSYIPKIVLEGEDVYVKFSGLSFRLNLEHYRKLQILFDRMHPNSTDRASHESDFASSLFCLLCRYDMLQGAGLQSSMYGSVFDVLLQHYDCRLECFASPLNSRYERFCSAFFDTDAPFGSVASFFDYDFTREGGCYQANPPFATNFIEKMYEIMERALKRCEAPLMFVVFVPAWKETPGWNLLNDSPHLTKHVSLSQSSHFYCEGTQHRRKDRYRVASFDTSVFFLQNEAARAKWNVLDSHIADLKSAFSMDGTQAQGGVGVEPSTMKKQPPTRTATVPYGGSGSKKSTVERQDARPPSKKKSNKKKSRKEKARLLPEGEERAQQLDILNSLGISLGDASQEGGAATSKRKKRRK